MKNILLFFGILFSLYGHSQAKVFILLKNQK